MIVKHQYIPPAECEGMGCPFCGKEATFTPAYTDMSLPKFYCNSCKVEFTIEERIYDEEAWEVRNYNVSQCLDKWDTRAEGAGPEDCPFCGGKIEEWSWGHYLFDSLWCPTCKKRFEFQSHPHSKKSMARTMREFGRRAAK